RPLSFCRGLCPARHGCRAYEKTRSVAPSPFLLCRLTCGISSVACYLLLSLQRGFAFGLLGSLTLRLFRCDAHGFGGALVAPRSLPGELPFIFNSRSLALHHAFCTRRHDGLPLSSLLYCGGIVGGRGLLELGQHRALCLGGELQAIFEVLVITAAHR